MSLFWVLRDMAEKQFIPSNKMEEAQNCLEYMEKLLPNMMDENKIGEKAYQKLYKLILPHASEVKSVLELSKTNPNEAYHKITEFVGTDAKQLDKKLHEDFGWVVYRYMKANADQFTSVQIRYLLRNYMQLKNTRPSLLHSTILNYALNFSKGHPDFSFYKFFMLWNAENLRGKDYEEGDIDGHKISSLISRICRCIIESNEIFDASDFVSKFDKQNIIIEHLRQAYFWKLMNLHKENRFNELFNAFDFYAENYSKFGPSHWHSEILRIANRFMTEKNASKFSSFVIRWNGAGNFRKEDWVKEKNDEGQEFPSLAVKSAKKCFDIIKATPKNMVSDTILAWLKEMYKEIRQLDSNDDWSARNYAMICTWCGNTEEAISIYKSLLLHMGEKFYLWSELANLIPNNIDLSIGLLLKAKMLEKDENFLGDIHLSLASLWLKKNCGAIANKELNEYATQREKKGWSISDHYRELQAEAVKLKNETENINFDFFISEAEDFIYEDFEWTDFAITDKRKVEGIERCNLNNGKRINLYVKTKRFPTLKKSKVGDIVQLKCVSVEEKTSYNSFSSKKDSATKKYIPLVARKTDKIAWSIFPIKYGVIDYINEAKKVLHIITQYSELVFFEYKGKPLPINSFVKFREYEDSRKDKKHTHIANVEPCPSDEALQYMQKGIVVVDDVNTQKGLFHIVSKQGIISDIIRFNQTNIHPSIGDFLHIVYCTKKNKEGEKRVKFLDIQTSEVGCDGLRNTIKGLLKLKYNGGFHYSEDEPDFAFVNDYYVHRKLLQKYKITHDCNVVAHIVLGGDNKWKVYDLEIVQ